MSRIYSRAGVGHNEGPALDVADRERQPIVRHSVHTDRDATADREDGVRRETKNASAWINPASLEAPRPRPGFVQRWIADGMLSGSANEKNWSKRMREGWSPRDASTIPESQRTGYPTAKTPSGSDCVRVAGMVLCEMPQQIARQRYDAVHDLIRRQSKSMPESMEELRRKGRTNGLDIDQADEEATYRGRRAATMTD
jgi:hypothetical protein